MIHCKLAFECWWSNRGKYRIFFRIKKNVRVPPTGYLHHCADRRVSEFRAVHGGLEEGHRLAQNGDHVGETLVGAERLPHL